MKWPLFYHYYIKITALCCTISTLISLIVCQFIYVTAKIRTEALNQNIQQLHSLYPTILSISIKEINKKKPPQIITITFEIYITFVWSQTTIQQYKWLIQPFYKHINSREKLSNFVRKRIYFVIQLCFFYVFCYLAIKWE